MKTVLTILGDIIGAVAIFGTGYVALVIGYAVGP